MSRFIPLFALVLVGCPSPRDSPLSSDEFGDTFFWQVTSSEIAFEECTDAESWQDQIEAPEFDENTFIIYRVESDGSRAISQSCETTRADTCSDSALDIAFDIDDNILTYDPAPVLNNELSATCSLFQDELWTMEDFGETLTMSVEVEFTLDGNEMTCTNIEDAVKAESTNNLGIDKCKVTITVDSEFFTTDR